MTSSSIDELLGYEEEPEPKPTSHRERPSRWLIKSVLLSVIGGAVEYGLLRVGGAEIAYPFLVALTFTLVVVRRVVRDVAVAPVPETLRKPPPAPSAGGDGGGGWGERDGLRLAVTGWGTRLAWLHSRSDPRQFIRNVQPRLVQIVDERLRLRHGITLTGDPARARELLGEPLWAFVSTPVRKNPTPRELAALVNHMEDI
jgi:hypothetical protein